MARYDYGKHSPLPSLAHESKPKLTRAGSHAFRLMRLHPEGHLGRNAQLECNLVVYDLPFDEAAVKSSSDKAPKRPPYDALSYNWGPEGGTLFVRVLVEGEAYIIPIRRNLEAALRHLRSPRHFVYLWVDALCMDQENKEEKSFQIPLMHLIYNRAHSVRIWLGAEADNSNRAIDFVSQCLNLDNFDKLVKDPYTSKDWAALSSLMRRPWFNRRWIIQEIAVARTAHVICGDKSISWLDFASVISMISKRQSELRRLFRESNTYHNHPDYLGDLSELGAIRLAGMWDNLFRKSEEGNILDHLFSLESLMSSLTAFQASDPHDVLYAVLWLANDAVPVTKNAYLNMRPQNQYGPVTPIEFTQSPVTSLNGQTSPAVERTFSQAFLEPRVGLAGRKLSPGRPSVRQRSQSDVTFSKSTAAKPPLGYADAIPELALTGPEQHAVPKPYATNGNESSATGGAKDDAADENGQPNGTADDAPVSPGNPVTSRPSSRQSFASSYSSHNADSRSHRPTLSIDTVFDDPTDEQKVAQKFWKAISHRHIVVDYEKSVFQMCKDFLEFCIKRSKSLDMLCMPWAPNEDDLPSWVSCLKGGAFAPNINGIHGRVNADPLVGRPGHHGGVPKAYRASKGMPARWSFKPGHERCLEVKGFVIDRVRDKLPPASGGTIPTAWLDAGGWKDTCQPPPDVFWRTLVGNREADGSLPSAYWKKICRDAFTSRPPGYDINTNDIMYECPSFVEEFLKRVQRMVWSRRLITLRRLTQSRKALGLAPRGTKKGDLICILYGCSVPVVLREMVNDKPAAKRHKCEHKDCPHGQSTITTHYEFVGECYVHGMMDGEAFSLKAHHKIDDQQFELL